MWFPRTSFTQVVTDSPGIDNVLLFQRSRLIRNPLYRGALRVDGPWHDAWTLTSD